YTEDKAVLRAWIPLMMEGRDATETMAATRMEIGTGVTFGALTRDLMSHLPTTDNIKLSRNQQVRDIERDDDGRREVELKVMNTGEKREIKAQFVFIGAGGRSLLLLEKSGIPEAKGYGGFPVGGQWLRCTNPEI